MRLNKFLAFRGVGSRRKCDEMIAAGRVSVNGRVVRELGVQVEERDKVAVDGRPVGGRERHVYYVLNKPVGVITTLDDPQGRRTIREFLPRGARVYPVGRLDADTSGLLLLTNDGELAHRLMHPRYGVPKVYRVRLASEPRSDQLRRLGSGVRFDGDQVSGPARVRRIDPGFDAIMIEVTIHEGRFRQVRKMCEAVGLDVTGLHRVGYGPLRLGPMTRGMFRELSAEEVASLRAASARPEGRWAPADRERRGRPGAAPRSGDASREAKRARRATPSPAEEPVAEMAEVLEDEAEEDEATWVPGGGYVPREDDEEDAGSGEAPESSEWPARSSGLRGDRDWRATSEGRERPSRERPPAGRDRAPAPGRRERPRPSRDDRAPRAGSGERRGREPRGRERDASPRPYPRGPRTRPDDRGRRREFGSGERASGAPPRGPRTRSGGAPPRGPRTRPDDRGRRRETGWSERPRAERPRSDRARGPRTRPDERGRRRETPWRGRASDAPRSGGARGPRGRSGAPSSGAGPRRRPGAGGFPGRSPRNPSRRKSR